MTGIDSLCRTCMCPINGNNEDETDGYNIFETEGLVDKLSQCCDLEIQPYDEYPPQVCDACCMNILDFCDFREMCQESLLKFRKLLEEKNSRVEEILGDTTDAKSKGIIEDIIEIKSEYDSEEENDEPVLQTKECPVVETLKTATLEPLTDDVSQCIGQSPTIDHEPAKDVSHQPQIDVDKSKKDYNWQRYRPKDKNDKEDNLTMIPCAIPKGITIKRIGSVVANAGSDQSKAIPIRENATGAYLTLNDQDDNQHKYKRKRMDEYQDDEEHNKDDNNIENGDCPQDNELVDSDEDDNACYNDDDGSNSEVANIREKELDDVTNGFGDFENILEVNLNDENRSEGVATPVLDSTKTREHYVIEHFSVEKMDTASVKYLADKNDDECVDLDDLPTADKHLELYSLNGEERILDEDKSDKSSAPEESIVLKQNDDMKELIAVNLDETDELIFEDHSDEDVNYNDYNTGVEEIAEDIFGEPTEDEEVLSDTDIIMSNTETKTKEILKCSICPQTFVHQRHLEQHLRRHQDLHLLLCPRQNCERSFKNSSQLRYHLRRFHHDESDRSSDSDNSECDTKSTTFQKLECDMCPQTFKLPHRLEAHKRRHQGLPGYPCTRENCDRAYVRMSDLRLHLNDHDGIPRKIFKCDIDNCGQEYTTPSGYKIHLRKHHNIGPKVNKLKYVCEKCGATCPGITQLRIHSLSHVDRSQWPFVCDVEGCSKRMRTSNDLRTHKLRHNGIKLHVCPHCDKSFCTSTNLKSHINFHTLEKTWTCNICDKICSSPDNLKRHIRQKHQNKPQTRYSCRFCDKILTTINSRTKHELMHKDDGFFECDECGRKFTLFLNLVNHKKTHEKYNKCDQCGAQFKYESNLRQHCKKNSCKNAKSTKVKNTQKDDKEKLAYDKINIVEETISLEIEYV